MKHFDLDRLARLNHLGTVDAVAGQLSLSPSTLRRWLREGRIHGHSFDAAAWSETLKFSTPPAVYLRAREVLADASRRPCAAHES